MKRLDYTETFSPVVRQSCVRVFFSLAVIFQWYLLQLDVHIAFLNEDLVENIYMDMKRVHLFCKWEEACLLTE